MAKRGRQPTYKPEYAEMAGLICSETGAIDKNLAKIFKVTERCIRKWKVEHPKFAKAVDSGKKTFNLEPVVNSLLRKALGYEYYEEYYELSQKTNKFVCVRKVKKHQSPDGPSIFYLLGNKDPENWKDVRRLEHSVEKSTMSEVAKIMYGLQEKDDSGSD